MEEEREETHCHGGNMPEGELRRDEGVRQRRKTKKSGEK